MSQSFQQLGAKLRATALMVESDEDGTDVLPLSQAARDSGLERTQGIPPKSKKAAPKTESFLDFVNSLTIQI